MKEIWNNHTLSKALEVEIPYDLSTSILKFNSKSVIPGDLFVALKGTRDGHDFVKDAFDRGAVAALVSDEVIFHEYPNKTILVKNTFEALQTLARYKRKNSKAKFIALTGSVGKTTTKEMLKTALQGEKIFVSYASYNNLLGVCLSLASISEDVEIVVQELGMNHTGEISVLSQIVMPDIAILLNVYEVHAENFDSITEIASAKAEIFEGMSGDKIGIVNSSFTSFPEVSEILELTANKKFIFGEDSSSDCCFKKILENKYSFTLRGKEYFIDNPSLPLHLAYNMSAVLLVCALLNMNMKQVICNLKNFKLQDGRGKVHRLNNGSINYSIIDESYNASPISIRKALKEFKKFDSKRKIFVFGDMLELGNKSLECHQQIKRYIVENNISKVITVGKWTKYLQAILPIEIQWRHCVDVYEVIEFIQDKIEESDSILCKGSRGIKLDLLVKYFLK